MYDHVKNKYRRVYSAMVTCMDEAIGQVMRALHKKGIIDNTLIIFTSDVSFFYVTITLYHLYLICLIIKTGRLTFSPHTCKVLGLNS